MKELLAVLEAGRHERIPALVEDSLTRHSPQAVCDALTEGMGRVSARYRAGELFLPEVFACARAMNAALTALRPALGNRRFLARAAVCTVRGDLHDVGKNLVKMFLESAGFETEDLGVDCPPERVVRAAREGARLVCLSCMLTTALPAMEETVRALERAGVRGRIRLMVGGASVTQAFAERIGADAYTEDAAAAAQTARAFFEEERDGATRKDG